MQTVMNEIVLCIIILVSGDLYFESVAEFYTHDANFKLMKVIFLFCVGIFYEYLLGKVHGKSQS